MALREEMESQGQWLFRWRSYIPLLLFIPLFFALREGDYLERNVGEWVDNLYKAGCFTISFFGLFIRGLTLGFTPEGTSGRNTKKQIAEQLNTSGMYSIVRHPLYLGNFIIVLGISMFLEVWWFSTIIMLIYYLYYERIVFTEEEFLRRKFGEEYLRWAEVTPAFFPRIRSWKKAELSFSLRNVLKREYSGFFAIIATYTFLEFLIDLVAEHKIEYALGWYIFFGTGLIIYLILRFLKKKTRLLHVEGR